MYILFHLFAHGVSLSFLSRSHSIFPEASLSLLFDLRYTFHSTNSLNHQRPIILNGNIAPLFELKSLVDGHLLAESKPICFSPLNFSGIALHLEVFVAFRPTESEDFAIVADEGNSVPRKNITGAEISLFNPHLLIIITKSVAEPINLRWVSFS